MIRMTRYLVLSLLCLTTYLSGQQANQLELATRSTSSYGYLVTQGKVEYAQRDTGMARLLWERALLIDPNGREALQNIAYLSRNMPDEVIPAKPFFAARWWHAFALLGSPLMWLVLQAAVLTVWMYVMYRLWLVPDPSMLIRSLAYGMPILGLITYAAGHHVQAYREAADVGIVLERCVAYQGPDDRSDAITLVAPGHKIIIIDSIGDWVKIAKLDREQGWIEASCYVPL